MKKLTINEFMELVKGKRWKVETVCPDFGMGLYFDGAEITHDDDMKYIAITNSGNSFYIENYNETITAIEQDGEEITVSLYNLPDLTFTESIF